MPRYAKGDIVWVPFPFSADEGYKTRPAIVMASWPCKGTTDYHLCMVSTQKETDPYLMELNNADLIDGHINRTCYIRPTYNFSADEDFIESRFGKLKPDKMKAVLYTLFTVLTKDDKD